MKTTVPRSIIFIPFAFYFILCICSTNTLFAQTVDIGKSYINVTKGLNGGTLETGDTMEIRASFVVRSGTYDSCSYSDAIPAGTSFISGSIKVLTNEGKTYKSFTDGYGDDAGWISGTNIRINLGYNAAAAPATAFRRGRVANTYKPSFYGSACIMIASFRVKITAVTGTNISTGGGTITYKNGAAAIQTFTFPANTVQVYPNYGICSNTIGTNAIGAETNGTFGSGKPRNRGASANVPVGYTYSYFDVGAPQDYSYGIANNTSTRPNYTTLNTWAKPDATSPTHRVFTLWDIIGDHTGAASPTAGNPAADTVVNANAGYMLIINAAYRIDSAFQQTISGLCPNTYYEISCWMRNICSKCGCDSNGTGASGAGYIPTAAGDSSGVRPNLTFDVDGIDYYTTGNLLYNGQWIKKGFTFLTGVSQTSFTLKFFNNAPGGGGNDWVLDDIAVSTCSPNMRYSPSNTPTVCYNNVITLYDTVRSYFNNYVYYKWQRSTDAGATWTDITAPAGPASPVWNGTAWQYVTSYTVPPSQSQLANNGNLYRLVVATTSSNLTDVNCRFTDTGNIITLTTIDCGFPLQTRLVSFNGQLLNCMAILKWTTTTEKEPLYFDIEKSNDGAEFTTIATINNYYDSTLEQNLYSYTDPEPITQNVFYRIKIRNSAMQSEYSRTIELLTDPTIFSFISVVNPFGDQLVFDVTSDHNGNSSAELVDQFGNIVKKYFFDLTTGVNHLALPNTSVIPTGVYVLRVQSKGVVIQRKVIKL